jgi:hypothetical protein
MMKPSRCGGSVVRRRLHIQNLDVQVPGVVTRPAADPQNDALGSLPEEDPFNQPPDIAGVSRAEGGTGANPAREEFLDLGFGQTVLAGEPGQYLSAGLVQTEPLVEQFLVESVEETHGYPL